MINGGTQENMTISHNFTCKYLDIGTLILPVITVWTLMFLLITGVKDQYSHRCNGVLDMLVIWPHSGLMYEVSGGIIFISLEFKNNLSGNWQLRFVLIFKSLCLFK